MKCNHSYPHRKRQTLCCMFLLLSVILSLLPQTAFAAESRVIRVGYDSNSNFIKENGGQHYGYGVEYLEKIAEYTGWTYEYVKDDSWHDSMDNLRNGTVDLICTAHYTEQRATEFLYSTYPIGYETSILYAKEDSSIFYQDYDAMQGKKVGLLVESFSAGDFKQHAAAKQISYEGVYFHRENDMKNALEQGEIDMMVVGSRYATPNLKLVDISGIDTFYCIAQPGDYALIEEIDTVLKEIMFDDPSFSGNLSAKYFGHEAISSSPLYTKEEQAYIQSLGTLRVKLLQNQHPSCYVEDGETKGIWAEVIRLLAQKSGIDLVLEGSDGEQYSAETYQQLINDDYLLLRTQNAMQYMSGMEGTIVSTPITNVSVAYVKRQAAFIEDTYATHIIAMTQDLAYLEPILLDENPDYEVQYFKDAKACFEALMNKQASLVIQNSHRASYLMQKPEYTDNLTVVPGIEHKNEVCLVVPQDQQMLIQVINKAIHHIPDTAINEIVKRELLMSPYVLEAEDFVYQNWNWLFLTAVLLLIAIISYAVFTYRLANARIQKREFERLQKQVQQDELTGLYNRSYFYETARELIQQSVEDMYIISMDISNFKVVNEHYGMHAGDRLLKEIGAQLRQLAPDHRILIARFMVDHYYMCVPKSEFDRLFLPKSFKTFLEDIDIRVVYGVFPVEDKDLPIHVMCDRALVAAHDKNYTYVEYIHFYNDSVRQQTLLEQEIENEMEQALAQRQFYVVVQPKYDPTKEEVVGGEALVRWQHPKKGIISPGVFIKIFERNGFIAQLDYFVWEETCRLQAQMQENGIQIVPISINVSRIHFYSSELRNKLLELVQKYHLSPSDIELEITESLCSEEPGTIFDMLRNLQADGFRIAMDDFGSGYSSLNMLKEMPLDILKMDLKFLDGDESKGQVILTSLIQMAQTMDLTVVVEGVELLSQVEFLRKFEHCYAQGYYYSRPITPNLFEGLLQKN